MVSDPLNLAISCRSISASSFPLSQNRGFADMTLFVARRLGVVAIVAIAVGACSPQSSVAAVAADSQPAPVAAPSQPPSSPQPVGTLNGRVLPDFATLVEQVGPAVVNVSVVEKARRARNNSADGETEDPVQEFFR